ncbi:hypothetical protein PMAYCL1PPCAC_20823, partial [Pristionchus mayeri]
NLLLFSVIQIRIEMSPQFKLSREFFIASETNVGRDELLLFSVIQICSLGIHQFVKGEIAAGALKCVLILVSISVISEST